MVERKDALENSGDFMQRSGHGKIQKYRDYTNKIKT